MKTNSNMDAAVRQMMNDCHDCRTWVELVRELREQGFEPSMEEVQKVLADMLKAGSLWMDDALKLSDGGMTADILDNSSYAVTWCYALSQVEDDLLCDGLAVEPVGLIFGIGDDAEKMYQVAATDWFGRDGVHTVWEYCGDDEGEETAWRPLYHILGQAERKAPVMPPREEVAARVPEDQYVEAELEAVKAALLGSIDKGVYKRLRDGSGSIVKLTFGVTVDRGQMDVDAKMSGTTKLENRCSAGIKDPAQMELGL